MLFNGGGMLSVELNVVIVDIFGSFDEFKE